MSARSFGLTRRFPFLTAWFRLLIIKLLDFSDYKYIRAKVLRSDREREIAFARVHQKVEVDTTHEGFLELFLTGQTSILLERFGSKNDGGYFLPKTNFLEEPWITIGLGFNCDFENALASFSSAIDTFDHTIPFRPRNLNRRVRWHQLGYGSSSENSLRSLNEILKISNIGPDTNWNLKFDIEGNEWALLRDFLNLIEIQQAPLIIVSELHGLLWDSGSSDKLKILQSLSQSYVPVFSVGNNFSAICMTKSYTFYDVIEVTWLRRDLMNRTMKSSGSSLFSFPNDPSSPNYPLRFIT